MKKIIHVNQLVIRANHKTGARAPVFTIKTWKTNFKANAVRIEGPSQLVYSPDKPLACGAKAWLETDAPVVAGEVEIF